MTSKAKLREASEDLLIVARWAGWHCWKMSVVDDGAEQTAGWLLGAMQEQTGLRCSPAQKFWYRLTFFGICWRKPTFAIEACHRAVVMKAGVISGCFVDLVSVIEQTQCFEMTSSAQFSGVHGDTVAADAIIFRRRLETRSLRNAALVVPLISSAVKSTN